MMREEGVTQTIIVGDGSGKRGNCLQAAVASFYGYELQAVPDFANIGPLDEDGYGVWWWALFLGYFAQCGYIIRTVGLDQGNRPIPQERCIVFGDSPRGGGLNHVCVAQYGEITWDPHPSRDGLTAVKGAWVPESVMELKAIERAWNERARDSNVTDTDAIEAFNHPHPGAKGQPVIHRHAWGLTPHSHILRAVCCEPECLEFPTHNIHPMGTEQVRYPNE